MKDFIIGNRIGKNMAKGLLLTVIIMMSTSYSCIASPTTEQGVKELTALQEWKAGTPVTMDDIAFFGIDNCFKAEIISDRLFAKMQGKSYKKDCGIPRYTLRHIKVLHYNKEGMILIGELVCNEAIADDLVQIFRELFNHHYPIERIRLIDEYDGDDELSMRDNNTSCFNFRSIPGKKTLSKHSRGMAVDINTLYNPYVVKDAKGNTKVHPATATPYVNRSQAIPYKIDHNDLCYKLFKQHGFRWGGDWKNSKDYQHFDK